ncbi:hypothetical protein SRABI96_02444 [Peribacillus sp. Bi96]|uniref:ABC-three component system middle component 7 n=1 Tax=Peribacillus sp. Bi96 TaxID=2884273 RepID=UPI001E17EE2D|nr:ABC-three component system middle component 7 [Peribacillus sp. Bi96]CAH0222380.1 hypothetical protein SRABI96_02444 [Peribacillus sp. Bi96]
MIVPNKVISFSESIIGKMPIILKCLSKEEMTVKELFFTTQDYFDEIDEFIYALDALFLLDAIKVDFDKGVVTYVNKD